MVKWLRTEFIEGYNWFERIFFLAMIALQIIVYCFVPDTPVGIICGIAGVICVALTAKGKISSYFFNFIQMITYMLICWDARLFLEFGEQVFYFIVCIFGVFTWKKHMNDKQEVEAKKYKWWYWLVTAGVTAVGTVLIGWFGDNVLHSNLSYLDAITVVLAIIAQLLMVWRYREQWVVWIIIDAVSLVMFVILQNWSMVAMYTAWTINAIYGYWNWTKLTQQ